MRSDMWTRTVRAPQTALQRLVHECAAYVCIRLHKIVMAHALGSQVSLARLFCTQLHAGDLLLAEPVCECMDNPHSHFSVQRCVGVLHDV